MSRTVGQVIWDVYRPILERIVAWLNRRLG